jgi:hypothetical protein
MLLLAVSSVTCYLLGAVTGILIYRNNAAKLTAAEAKARAIADAAKAAANK